MRRAVLSAMAAAAMTLGSGAAALAQTPSSGPPTTPSGTSTQPGTYGNDQTNRNTDVNGQTGTNGQMNLNVNGSMNGQAEAGAPSGAYYDSNGQLVVPVHPPTWEYDMMAQQYHWNSPPPGATH